MFTRRRSSWRRSPSTRVVGAEPERADDARRSLASGRIEPSNDPRTIADGLRTSLSTRTFSVLRDRVDPVGPIGNFVKRVLTSHRPRWSYDEAAESFRRALALQPKDGWAVHAVGRRWPGTLAARRSSSRSMLHLPRCGWANAP